MSNHPAVGLERPHDSLVVCIPRWHCSPVAFWTRPHHKRQRQPLLVLVLPLLISITGLAHFVTAQEQNLSNAFVGVDLRGQWGRVADLERDLAAPFRLQRRHVDDDAAAGISTLANADGDYVAGDFQVL